MRVGPITKIVLRVRPSTQFWWWGDRDFSFMWWGCLFVPPFWAPTVSPSPVSFLRSSGSTSEMVYCPEKLAPLSSLSQILESIFVWMVVVSKSAELRKLPNFLTPPPTYRPYKFHQLLPPREQPALQPGRRVRYSLHTSSPPKAIPDGVEPVSFAFPP